MQKDTKATSGQVIFTLPSPEDMEKRGKELESLRSELATIRGKVDDLRSLLIKEGHFDDDGITRDYRDVNTFLTAAISRLYESAIGFPKWAETKREMLTHPEIYMIREGLPVLRG